MLLRVFFNLLIPFYAYLFTQIYFSLKCFLLCQIFTYKNYKYELFGSSYCVE